MGDLMMISEEKKGYIKAGKKKKRTNDEGGKK